MTKAKKTIPAHTRAKRRKSKPKASKGWQVFRDGLHHWGVTVDGVQVIRINPNMVAEGESAIILDAMLRDFATSLSAHQALREAVFTVYPKLAAHKDATKLFRKELALMEKAMDKSTGRA